MKLHCFKFSVFIATHFQHLTLVHIYFPGTQHPIWDGDGWHGLGDQHEWDHNTSGFPKQTWEVWGRNYAAMQLNSRNVQAWLYVDCMSQNALLWCLSVVLWPAMLCSTLKAQPANCSPCPKTELFTASVVGIKFWRHTNTHMMTAASLTKCFS